MAMIRKEQVENIGGRYIRDQATFARLFQIAACTMAARVWPGPVENFATEPVV
jgi:hypothetical protein